MTEGREDAPHDDHHTTGTRCGVACQEHGRPCQYLGGETHDGRLGQGGNASRHACDYPNCSQG